MRRWLSLSMALGLFALVGCGTDMHENLTKKVIAILEQAGTYVNTIKDEVDKAHKATGGDKTVFRRTEKNKDKSDTVYEALAKAEQTADDGLDEGTQRTYSSLKKLGMRLTEVKQEIDLVKTDFTSEQQAANAKKYKDKLSGAVETLSLGKLELQKSLAKFDDMGKEARDALKNLREKIREADGQFESLVRPR